ncbi:MAG TPA: PfkB family carbohydrate kinase [Gaiellaceae bacterium]
MKAAVVGHVEWVDFVPVERVPQAGEIFTTVDHWSEPAGGGAVSAGELVRLGAETTFFTAVGDDELGRRAEEALRALGLRLEVAVKDAPQRRALTYLDARGERTITVLGDKLHPLASDPLAWDELDSTDAVYFTSGDVGALREARRAGILVATARELPTLRPAGVQLDALVHSARDPAERYQPGDIDPAPRLVATTEGAAGGRYVVDGEEGRWEAAPLPGPLQDVYGAGDSFAAALAFALADDRTPQEAVDFAALSAARAMTRRGAFGNPAGPR